MNHFFILFSALISIVSYGQDCSNMTREDFQKQLDRWGIEARCEMSSYAAREVLNFIERCGSRIQQLEIQQCFVNAKKHATAISKQSQSGHSLRFMISDEKYIASRPKPVIALPGELSDGLPENWRELAEQKGWRAVEYRSRTVSNPGPSNSYRRALIMVEGDAFDRWIQFTLPEPGSARPERLIDLIGVEKSRPNDHGELNRLDQPKIHFAQYWRDPNGRNPQIRSGFDSCYSCHPAGIRRISHAHGSANAADKQTIGQLNSLMDRYTYGINGFDWGGAIDTTAHGPSMGSNQSCTKCHSNFAHPMHGYVGTLNCQFSRTHMQHKVFSGDMKMGFYQDVLNPFEHAVLGSIRRPLRHQAIWGILDRAEQLSSDEKNQLFSYTKSGENIPTLEFLQRKDLLTGEEFQRATEDLNLMRAGYRQVYDQMYDDYNKEFAEWIRGGAEGCAAQTPLEMN